jgi:hypothetical protein
VYLELVEAADGVVTVDVVAANVTNMYGAEFHLKFDPQQVTVQDANPDQQGIQIQPGTLLSPDQGFVVANEVDEAAGTVGFALTLLNPAPPVTGSGPLARVTFVMLQGEPATIDVERAKLVAIDLQTIPSQTSPLTVGVGELADPSSQALPPQEVTVPQESAQQGAVQPEARQQQVVVQQQPNAPVQPAVEEPALAPAQTEDRGSDFPWWIVAAAIMVLGLLGLGALLAFGGLAGPGTIDRRQSSSQPQDRYPSAAFQQRLDKPGSGHPPGTRPSAFN